VLCWLNEAGSCLLLKDGVQHLLKYQYRNRLDRPVRLQQCHLQGECVRLELRCGAVREQTRLREKIKTIPTEKQKKLLWKKKVKVKVKGD